MPAEGLDTGSSLHALVQVAWLQNAPPPATCCGLPEDCGGGPAPTRLAVDGERVVCGYLHTLLLEQGNVVTWGVNDEGALGRGGDEAPGPVAIGERIVDIAAGGSISAAVSASNNLYIWGTFRDQHGVFGAAPDCAIAHRPLCVLGDVVKAACGKNFVAALTRQGGLVTFGVGTNNELGYRASTRLKRCLLPRQISNRYKKRERFVHVFAGQGYGMAINHENALFSWANLRLQCVSELAVKDVAMGSAHEHLLTVEGVLYGRGENRDGQLGLGHTRSAAEEASEWQRLGLSSVEKVRTKMDFSLAQIDNSLYSWGPSTFGETGFDTDSCSPRRVPFDFGEIVDFSAGSDFSVVIGK
ncbi:UNVERIFIED_CONTAM: hypothetical protein PYX00_011510 [Menopon gallinae]|uniref:RCC1-like domain-containing protein n=1 Tax=Menopon gallinae TaxID=328185 RepID=A0AAW2H7T6_9NEOP